MQNGIRFFVLWLTLAAFGWTFEAAAATYTVVNTEDAGAGSLRQAILDANSHAGPDIIMFSIPKTVPDQFNQYSYGTLCGIFHERVSNARLRAFDFPHSLSQRVI